MGAIFLVNLWNSLLAKGISDLYNWPAKMRAHAIITIIICTIYSLVFIIFKFAKLHARTHTRAPSSENFNSAFCYCYYHVIIDT